MQGKFDLRLPQRWCREFWS